MPDSNFEGAAFTRKQKIDEHTQLETLAGAELAGDDDVSSAHKDTWGAGATKDWSTGYGSREHSILVEEDKPLVLPNNLDALIEAKRNLQSLDRAILHSVCDAIQSVKAGDKLNFETRSAIVRWADAQDVKDPKELQTQLNSVLNKFGRNAIFTTSNYKNYLGEDVPITTVTMEYGAAGKAVETDKFSFTGTSKAERALLGGQSAGHGNTILTEADPSKTYPDSMIKNMEDLRALRHLFHSKMMKDGEITFKEAANNEKRFPELEHTYNYLQNNFGKLTMKDEEGSTISQKDLRLAMEESVSSLIQQSLSKSGLRRRDELVEQMVKIALQDNYVGLSDTFTKTLNAALDKHGYNANLSPKTRDHKTIAGESMRTLTIIDEKVPRLEKKINITVPDPRLHYFGYIRTAPVKDWQTADY